MAMELRSPLGPPVEMPLRLLKYYWDTKMPNMQTIVLFIMVLIYLVLDEITASFRRFGHLFVDWPHKAESKSYFPPKGESSCALL